MNGGEYAAARGSVVTLYTAGYTVGDQPIEVHIGGRRKCSRRRYRRRVREWLRCGSRCRTRRSRGRSSQYLGNLFTQPGVALAIQQGNPPARRSTDQLRTRTESSSLVGSNKVVRRSAIARASVCKRPPRNSLNVDRPAGSPKKCSSALIAAPLNSGPLVVCFLTVPNAEESPANVPCYTLNSFSWSAPYRAVGIYEQTSGTPRSAGSGSRR
jgi:hypothetical protein